jgi:hypothetical protein
LQLNLVGAIAEFVILNMTLEQKARLLAILPSYPAQGNGRPRADVVQVFLGIVWVLVTGGTLGGHRQAAVRLAPNLPALLR